MFDFLLKRAGKPDPAPSTEPLQDAKSAPQAARLQALAGADALSDEAAAADFILQTEFSEARLKAAAHIHSKPVLEQIAHAMRNADRRVAKLMQQRLEQIVQAEQCAQKAEHCIGEAQRLVQEAHLMPNQVADLDRAWQLTGDAPEPLRAAFERERTVLRERLESQAALQRTVLDVRNALQQVIDTLTVAENPVSPTDIARTVDILQRAMTQHYASREAASLPRHLLSEFEQLLQNVQLLFAVQEKRRSAVAAREQMLMRCEAAPAGELKAEQLKREWQSLPPLHDSDAAAPDLRLEERFAALLERCTQPAASQVASQTSSQNKTARRKKSGREVPLDAMLDAAPKVDEILNAMERALEEGALQLAAEHDKTLRALDIKTLHLSEKQAMRLTKARSELSRLQGWARWGGNISREELLKAAEELPAQSPAPDELAKKVGSLRERWKSLDVSAGPAPKALWERFDAACTTAYAPAAAHFKKLADERRDNQHKAQALIEEVRQFAATSGCVAADAADTSTADWKAIAAYCARMPQIWQRLGPIGRKEKKALDAEFRNALRAITEPLAARRQIEIAVREKLIEEAAGLKPNERHALETLRNLQERWQAHAKSLPLDRQDEQALWQRFRSACDAAYAKRKETAHAAGADRQQHLRQKESLCADLEAAAAESITNIQQVMRSGRQAWEKTGPVPRADERRIEARYQAALAALNLKLDNARRVALQAQSQALSGKLKLCREIEQTLATATDPGDAVMLARWQTDWQALPALSRDAEAALQRRFDAALIALASGERDYARDYAAKLEMNQAALKRMVLRLEILMHIDSPPELSRERLQLQVEVLRTSLKTGQKEGAQRALLLELCGMPALTDSQTADRIAPLLKGLA